MLLFLTRQKASKGNNLYPVGEKHAAIIFVSAEDIDKGTKRLFGFLEENCWESIEILRVVNQPNSETIKEGGIDAKETYETALKEGIAMMLYEVPIP